MYDDSIANALINKGAEAVVGFTNIVSTTYCNQTLFETVINSMVLSADNISNDVREAKRIYGDRDPYVWQQSHIETKLKMKGKISTKLVNSIFQIKYLDQIPIVESDRYDGNLGDSFVYPIGKHGNTRGWIARWNYTEESSWAYSTFNLNGKYSKLTGNCNLIQSYNTSNFSTTLEFWADGKLIGIYVLTPDTIPFDIELDVSKCNNLKIYFYDNKSVMGGTSFGLTNMILN